MQGLLAIVLALTALLLPGVAAARLLRSPAPLAAGLLLGHLALVLALLGLDAVGVPLRAWTVVPLLLAVGVTLGALAWRSPPSTPPGPLPGSTAAWAVIVVLAVLLGYRVAMQPLTGADTPFRWAFLAERLLERGTLDFYPPVTAQDFATYAFPDSIPPLCQSALWLLYACAGEVSPRLSVALAVAQWLALCGVAARLGAHLGGERAGAPSALVLAATPLVMRAVAIGQETGLLALALGVATLALVRAGADAPRAATLAGLACAAAGLTREYALAFGPCALLVAWRSGLPRRALPGLASALLAVPWYLRTWVRTGNPLFDLDVLGLFSRNEVRAALATEAPSHPLWPAAAQLGQFAAPAIALGVIGLARPAARPLIAPVGLVVGLWAWSVPHTSGGPVYSLRVLAPALLLLSAAGGPVLARVVLETRLAARVAGLAALSAALGWAFVCTLAFPLSPAADVRWGRALTMSTPILTPAGQALPDELARVLPPGGRVLARNPYVHAVLAGSANEAVIVWSPEVAFLFAADAPPWPEAVARLRALGIVGYVRQPEGPWLRRVPFFVEARARGTTVLEGVQGYDVVVFR